MSDSIAKDLDTFLSYQFFDQESAVFQRIESLNRIPVHWSFHHDSYADVIASVLEDALLRELRKTWDEPLGVLLSGGVDSFLLLYFLRKHAPGREIYTYTLLSHQRGGAAEKIEAISRAFGTRHRTYLHTFEFGSILKELSVLHRRHKTFPSADLGHLTNEYLLRKIRKENPSLVHMFSGVGMDVLFGGMDMYRYSFLERSVTEGAEDAFLEYRERQYFHAMKDRYDQIFFYKYGEYFWVPDMWGIFREDTRRTFHRYYGLISSQRYDTELKRQIVFNLAFLVENRRGHVESAAQYYWFRSVTPFMQDELVREALSLCIPDELLVDGFGTKKVIRDIGERAKQELGLSIDFFDAGDKDLHHTFQDHKTHILQVAGRLLDEGIISYPYYSLLPQIIDASVWHENRMRIYILLNLYFFMRSRI